MTTTSPESPGGGILATDAPAVDLLAVAIRYPRPGDEPLTIVENYDLRMVAGDFHSFAGRSGSGKTSILRVAAGLVPPTEGRVLWQGLEITGLADDVITARRRRHVGYLDQGGNLVPGLTALENVLLPAVPDRRTRELARKARDILNELGVGDRASHYPDRLSGGERQRVALARALVLDPAVVMADEPTASLDRASADALISLLRRLADRGTAVLVASHDPNLIAAADSRTDLA
jgi:ABC-type lipoprotein export system ATPase subunit